MKLDTCGSVRLELSARLDGETTPEVEAMLAHHLESCAGCRRYDEKLHLLRRAVRLQPAGAVPDLTDRIRERVVLERNRTPRVSFLHEARIAVFAAAATIVVILVVNLPAVSPERDVATASEVIRGIRAAARSLSSYGATFDIVERNYASDVARRHFTARVRFAAPESLRLEVVDRTIADAGGYTPQGYKLVASARRWSAVEPSRCVPQSVHPCPSDDSRVRWGVANRQPFDGTTRVPTDIILPLQSIASAGDLNVLGERRMLGRDVVGVETSYAAALALVHALDPFEVWRPFHPLDSVRVWLDSKTWFPLALTVRADPSDQRREWALRHRFAPAAESDVLLRITATRLAEATPPPTPSHTDADFLDGGFEESSFRPIRNGPTFVAELSPYRSGTTATGDRVVAYADGLSWLRVATSPPRPPSLGALLASEEVHLDDKRVAYYTPASSGSARRIDVYGRAFDVRLESNLPRATLLRIARSVGLRGDSRSVARSEAAITRRVPLASVDKRDYARVPQYVPPGYTRAGAYVTSQRTGGSIVTLVYRRPETDLDPKGLRITQSPGLRRLPPTSEDFMAVPISGGVGRWSVARGELEWIDEGVYRSVSVPSLDLDLALRIAASLR